MKGVVSYHLGVSDQSTLNDCHRFSTKPSWIPHNQICKLANFDTTDNMAHSLSHSGIDTIFTNVPLDSKIVSAGTFIFFQESPLNFILMSCIPSSQDDFTTTAHGL